MIEPKVISQIVNQDLCTGCGICVSECRSSTLKMDWNELGFLVPYQISDCENDGNCIKVCPFNLFPEADVKDEDVLAEEFIKGVSSIDAKLGKFENTYIGYADKYRPSSSSGGIATYIFKKLWDEKIIDYLFIVKGNNGSYEYQFYDNFYDIEKISKTRYIPVTMEILFQQIDSLDGKIAVSGIACFIKAIRLKQHYHPIYKEKIPFLVGIICGGMKSKFFTDYLAQKSGVYGEYINPEYRIKDINSTSSDYSFGCYNKSENSFHALKMRSVGDMWGSGYFKNNACDFCNDVTTELADISLGDAWLDEYRIDGLGNSVIITRSKLADRIIQIGIKQKELIVKEESKNKIITSQSGNFNHRQENLYFRVKMQMNRGKLLPPQRERLFKNSKILLQLVQLCRRNTRAKSLQIWAKLKNAYFFDRKMKKHMLILRLVTKIQHKIKSFRTI